MYRVKAAMFYLDGQFRHIDRSAPFSWTESSAQLALPGHVLYGRHDLVVKLREVWHTWRK